jgi:hypothetical protein
MVTIAVAVCKPDVALIVYGVADFAVRGVPVISPVVELIVKPVGRGGVET